MKKYTLPLFALPLLGLGLAGCADPVGDAPRAEVKAAEAPSADAKPAAQPAAAGKAFAFSQEGSKIEFVGAKVTGKHDGGFNTFSGAITVPDGKVEQARVDVTIDMKSVWSDVEKLTGHLKSPDFFDVENIPTAKFVSKSVTAPGADGTSTVTGDLTLHGVTKTISFPAKIAVTGDTATATAEFGINRKDFGIVYPGMPDDLIKDEVLLKLNVAAKAQ